MTEQKKNTIKFSTIAIAELLTASTIPMISFGN